MERRQFLRIFPAGALVALAPAVSVAAPQHGRLLVLVELRGGNDGLNTVIPYADPLYIALRPRLGIRRDDVLQLDAATGLHPALRPLMPLWETGELAVVQSVGYPQPNLSHFRSIEIWDTASGSGEYLAEGWLARQFARQPVPADYLAEGVLVGSPEPGPLAGGRAIALRDIEQFRRQARLARSRAAEGNAALRHILQVDSDIVRAAARLEAQQSFKTQFPKGALGEAVRIGCQAVAGGRVAALRLTLGGFDTHQNQAGIHAGLLKQLAEGLLALRSALDELGRWQDTLVMTYGEFGRRPKENLSAGTDHGTAAPHFVLGGQVRGGLYGAPPALDRLDGNGNPAFAVDFRSLYATVLERWWDADSAEVLRGRYPPLDLLRA
ncbi:MAG: hypothetical protein H6R10_778 [Rhodocyclaceae bacterium]|nr:hypothetical protein [Rhodocyclaceae bacterium]